MLEITIEKQNIQGIPLLTISPANKQGCPMIFFIHGFQGDKIKGVEIGYRLAERGFFFVSMDAFLHGDRYDDWIETVGKIENAIYPPETGIDTFYLLHHIVVQNGLDVQTLIDHYQNDPRVDVSRIGVSGYSLGAFTTYYLCANDPRISVAVPIIGYPLSVYRWTDLIDECAYSNPDWGRIIQGLASETRRRTEYVRKVDSVEKMKNFAPKPLLILNGEYDMDAPKVYTLHFFRVIEPFYRDCPENLKLTFYDAAHQMVTPMQADAVEWFSHFLLE